MKRLKTILHILFPYVTIIILAMISISYLGRMLVEDYQERLIEEKRKGFEIAAERFGERLDRIEQMAYRIEGSTVIENYAYSILQGKEISLENYREIRNEISNYTQHADIVYIYLYDSKNHIIYSPDGMFRDPEQFFQYTYVIEGLTGEESVDRLQDLDHLEYSPVVSVTRRGSTSEYAEYKLCIPFEWNSDHALRLVLVMEASNLFEDFADLVEEGSGYAVYGKSGGLLYEQGEAPVIADEADGGTLRVTEKIQEDKKFRQLYPINDTDNLYGVFYLDKNEKWSVAFICEDPIPENGWEVPGFSVMVIVPVLAAVLLSVLLTYLRYREIRDLVGMLNIHPGSSDRKGSNQHDFGMIKESVARLVDENSKYKERIQDFRNTRRVEILDRLVRNAYVSSEEIDNALEEIQLKTEDHGCVVLCIRYEGSDYRRLIGENVTIKDLVRNMLADYAERKTEIFDSTARETVCILFVEEGISAENAVRSIIARLNVEIFYAYAVDAKISAGNVVDSIYQIGESYRQAKEVLKYRETAGNNVYLYADLQYLKDTYYYPVEFDELIYNYIAAGKAANAKEIVQRLYTENMERSSHMLSVTAIEMLRKRLEGCMLSVAKKYRLSVDSYLSKWQKEQNINQYFQLLNEFIDWITDEIGDERDSIQDQTGLRIMEYIEEHYGDNSLSLKQIAQEFGFQENYTSRLFKNTYGENLSVVIERIRMEKACELLTHVDLKISDISLSVGYSSDISFRRAFKKVTGMTPVEYREAHQGHV